MYIKFYYFSILANIYEWLKLLKYFFFLFLIQICCYLNKVINNNIKSNE